VSLLEMASYLLDCRLFLTGIDDHADEYPLRSPEEGLRRVPTHRPGHPNLIESLIRSTS
jgi:hypothetical protein